MKIRLIALAAGLALIALGGWWLFLA